MKGIRKGIPNKIQGCSTIVDIYKKSQKTAIGPFIMSLERFKCIWKTIALSAVKEAVEEAGEIDFKFRIGLVRIRKYEYVHVEGKPLMNHVLSEKLGYPVIQQKDHYVKVYWRKRDCKIRNKGLYSFIPNRKFERKAKQLFMLKQMDYFE